jgi:hypothetical protein
MRVFLPRRHSPLAIRAFPSGLGIMEIDRGVIMFVYRGLNNPEAICELNINMPSAESLLTVAKSRLQPYASQATEACANQLACSVSIVSASGYAKARALENFFDVLSS